MLEESKKQPAYDPEQPKTVSGVRHKGSDYYSDSQDGRRKPALLLSQQFHSKAGHTRKRQKSLVQREHYLRESTKEQAGYLELGGAHLYTVLHRVANPIGRVLLVGPFATERHSFYIPWVRWAKLLAARRIEALRYDYRGVGESTGAFEDMSFDTWVEDVEFLAGWLKSRSPHLPLILHGLELGALLASRAFAKGTGDALLLWEAPSNANEVLRKALRRSIALDNMFKYGDAQKPLFDYLRQLETEPLEVEGYRWSSKLWRDSLKFQAPFGKHGEAGTTSEGGRPVRFAQLDKSLVPLLGGASYTLINPDLDQLLADHFDWISQAGRK